MDFEKEITTAISKETGLSDLKLEVPPNLDLGDFAFPCFPLAKAMKKNPIEIAKDLSKKLSGKIKGVTEIKIAGAYLNFFIDKGSFGEQILKKILKEKNDFGRGYKKNKKIVVEYSAPNTNKPQHLGHIRNNITGMTASSIMDFNGFDVIKINWINDRGIHICKSMLAYMKWGNNKLPDKKSDHFVGDYYVLYSKEAEKNPAIEVEAQELLRKWENNDPKVKELWKKMNSWAYEGFNATYKKLGCSFDKWYFESEIYENGKKLVEEELKKGILTKENEGNIICRLEEFNMPNKVLLRADGTSIYATADIALAIEKAKLNPFKSIYVVGSEQRLYLQQMIKIFEILGLKEYSNACVHLNYGMIFLPEGKMKSREGKVVDADDIISDLENMAKDAIKERHPELSDEEITSRAEAIALAALKFYVLKFETPKDFVFNPKESISFEGETGPYLQYAYARICSILRNYDKEINKDVDFNLLSTKSEQELLRKISEFPTIINDASEHMKPSLLCRYLLDLSQSFTNFYHNNPVLKAKINLMEARILLAEGTRQVLHNGLIVLGIVPLERM